MFGFQRSLKIVLRFTEEINAYSFGTIWGWINDDRIFIFAWIQFNLSNIKLVVRWQIKIVNIYSKPQIYKQISL